MPTKTRLDPTAGGDSPPAGQDGAHGSGRGDNLASGGAGGARPADATGFIESLGALSAHITQREAFEADVRRGWTRMAGVCGIILVAESVAGGFIAAPIPGAPLGTPSAGTLALYAAALGTAALAALLFSAAAAAPWRAAADHVDRVALRHEDSPLRDRIRITQWMLFDAALSRFLANERRVNAIIAHGVMLVSVMAALCLALQGPLRAALGDPADGSGRAASASLALFLLLTILAIFSTMRSGKESFAAAQHYGRQVLAFDEDFGGFLPRAEREHVAKFAAAGAASSETEQEA